MERATRQHPFASFVGGLWMLLIVGLSFVGGADNSRPDKVKTDGPVGAISVHLVCGVFGAICVGLFAQAEFTPNTTGNGLFFGGGAGFLWRNFRLTLG